MKIFLCGDVMTGRGVDQALPHPCSPTIHEPYLRSAIDYLHLAERAHGPAPKPADFAYIWGAALDEWRRTRPDARVINVETAITHSETYRPKGINYRMSPQNAACFAAAEIDCCALANNHVLDWGSAGLLDTLETLAKLGVKMAGAGRNLAQANAPAILDAENEGRLLVFSFAFTSSGTPWDWAAGPDSPGVNLLSSLSEASVSAIAKQIAQSRRPRDVIVASIHWGPNWGYEITKAERCFAHELVDRARISILHGHSSHHAKAIEVYHNRLILYGCGDFLNDYEGITGYEQFRSDLVLMYFANIDPASGDLCALDMTPLQIRRLQLARPSHVDVNWLQQRLDRESAPFGARIAVASSGRLAASWGNVSAP